MPGNTGSKAHEYRRPRLAAEMRAENDAARTQSTWAFGDRREGVQTFCGRAPMGDELRPVVDEVVHHDPIPIGLIAIQKLLMQFVRLISVVAFGIFKEDG